MKIWMHKIELLVDKLIPWLLGVILAIIIVEFFFKDIAKKYDLLIDLLDGFIISVFVIDLIFKYVRAKNIPDFLRNSWLDIIAVFPFFLFFRAIEGIRTLIVPTEAITEGQRLLREGIELEKAGAKIVEEVEKAGKISRARIFSEIFKPQLLRPLLRSPRLIKIIPFFEKPTGKHHIYEK